MNVEGRVVTVNAGSATVISVGGFGATLNSGDNVQHYYNLLPLPFLLTMQTTRNTVTIYLQLSYFSLYNHFITFQRT